MKRGVLFLAMAAGFGIGLFAGRMLPPGRTSPAPQPSVPEPSRVQVWTCSMHPQIRQPKPGSCPICGMDLIPAADTASPAAGPREIVLSESAAALADVETAPVERRSVERAVRMGGKVAFDETRLATITARVPGRIDRLYANVTGAKVKRGEHLADLYSPELLSAQQELIQAARAAREAPPDGRASAAALADASREKLRLWGLTGEQVAEIERSAKARDVLTFYSPIEGVVVEKEALEGLYVETGMRLFTVADLSAVWVKLDAYESDLAWVRYGQEVDFEADAYPGETFHGTIALVDPVLDPMTRTVKVRVNAPNAAGRLKPEMFVRSVVRVKLAEDGTAAPPDLRGRWTCTMHPDVVRSGPGTCTVCGMPLVSSAEAGYPAAAGSTNAPLVIPASAPLVTGERAVAYVAAPGGEGRFDGREIVLGPKAGDYYVVRSGLREGERVVVRGAFKIDSSLQIEGKPSMMTGAVGIGVDGAPTSGVPAAPASR